MAYFLSPALAQLRAEINAVWPHRDKTSDGWIGDTSHAARPSDHNPDWSDGGIVRALDIDEDLVLGLTAVGEAMPLVNQIIRDRRTRYVIYEGRIWNVDTQRWSPYSGVNAHRHHVHVSVRKVGNYDRDTSSWGIARAISNPSGGSGGGISIPTVPGAPAPIIPEDFMSELSPTEQRALYNRIMRDGWSVKDEKNIYEAVTRIDSGVPKILDEIQTPAKLPARVWGVKAKHPLTGKDERAIDFLRYAPAFADATQAVVETVVAAIPGVDPKTVQDAVTQALKGAKITFTVED